MIRLGLTLGFALLVGGCTKAKPSPQPEAVLAPLLRVQPPFRKPPIFVTDIEALAQSGLLEIVTAQLEAAANADLSQLSSRGRVVLQNDAWGLVQRLKRLEVVSDEVRSLDLAARRLVSKLGLPGRELAWDPRVKLPEDAPAVVEGLREYGSELQSLQHERLYGYRRIFRIFQDGPHRVLMSQLVAIGTDGQPYLTTVIGEVEALALDGDTVLAAEVHHLERHGNYLSPTLEPIETIEHVPADGAHAYLVELEPAVPLSDLPCKQCHRTAFRMSLPEATPTPAKRWQGLLKELVQDRQLSATASIAAHP